MGDLTIVDYRKQTERSYRLCNLFGNGFPIIEVVRNILNFRGMIVAF